LRVANIEAAEITLNRRLADRCKVIVQDSEGSIKAPTSVAYREGESNMSAAIINLIIQLIGGAVGGNAAGGFLKNLSLGPLGNTIAGALGGGVGGKILAALIPALGAAAGSSFDIGAAGPASWWAVASPAQS
jgi:hypothetical protein